MIVTGSKATPEHLSTLTAHLTTVSRACLRSMRALRTHIRSPHQHISLRQTKATKASNYTTRPTSANVQKYTKLLMASEQAVALTY